MRRLRSILVGVTSVAVAAGSATAQDTGDINAWFAMMYTPYGALPMIVTPDSVGASPGARFPGSAFEVRYGRWAFENEEGFNTVGLGGRFGHTRFVLGYETCEGCDEGLMMAGVDFQSTLMRRPLGTEPSPSSMALGVRPSLGLGIATGGGDLYALAANVDFPLSVTMPIGEGSHLVPFAAPGFGFGRLSGGDDSEHGTLVSMTAGVGFMMSSRFGIHLAWRKIFIQDGTSTLGVGVSVGR